jgi:hypothetical protein
MNECDGVICGDGSLAEHSKKFELLQLEVVQPIRSLRFIGIRDVYNRLNLWSENFCNGSNFIIADIGSGFQQYRQKSFSLCHPLF